MKRRFNASLYFKFLDRKHVNLAEEKKDEFNTYHTFVIQVNNRDKLKKYLFKKDIQTAIHYPVPIHLQPACEYLCYKKGDFIETELQSKKILSLPIHQNLTKFQIKYISKSINNFFK